MILQELKVNFKKNNFSQKKSIMTKKIPINPKSDKYISNHFRINIVLDLGLFLLLLTRDLGRLKNKKKLIATEIAAGKPHIHLDPEMTEKINIAPKGTEMIANNPNIEMTVIETEKTKEIIEIETEIGNMMIVGIVKTETEKGEDQEIKIEKKKKNNKKIPKIYPLTITNYFLIKSQCQSKFLCLQSLDNVVEEKDPDLLLDTIEEIKIITMGNFGTLFHGYQESITLLMSHLQP